MYNEQPLILSLKHVSRLLELSSRVDLTPNAGGSRMSNYEETMRIVQPEFQSVFPGVWTRTTFVILAPSSQIVAHRDPAIRGIRHHVPLRVNSGCWYFHADVWQQLEVGHCYTMDPMKLHGAVNWGDTARLHLIVDLQ